MSDKPKYTPGPWEIRRVTHRDLRIAPEGDNNASIAGMGIWADHLWNEVDANARLIAAAPEMLEALHLAYGALTNALDGETHARIIDEVYAVIRKADGK